MSTISDDAKKNLGLDSLQKAQEYLENSNYGRAFAHYLVHLELLPESREEHELKFCDVLNVWCSILENGKRDEDVRKCYTDALKYFPKSEVILNNYGSYLMRIRKNYEAKKYLQLAFDLKPDSLPPEKNLQAVKLNLLERWHFRMLNDFHRNKAYHDAITFINCPFGTTALDIGSGSGILSLFASRNTKINHIFAVERSKTLSEISTAIFRLNRIENVSVLNMHSKQLSKSTISAISGRKCNLVITEIFDTALFGEHVLCTLIDLWENILPEKAQIIPYKADVYVTGIDCKNLYQNHKYIRNNRFLKLPNLCVTQETNHPYDAFHLSDFQYLTNSAIGCSVNFGNIVELKNIYSNFDAFSTINLDVLVKGKINALAIWFDLHLAENIVISTNPFTGTVKCWEQAIVFLDHPIHVTPPQLVRVKMSCVEDKLQAKIVSHNVPLNHSCFKIPPELIIFLNDEYLINTILSLCDTIEDKQVVVLDLFPFPIFGLMLAQKGAKVFSTASSDSEIAFIEKFSQIHSIDIANINMIDDKQLEEYMQYNNLFDIVFASPINSDGIVFQKNYTWFEFYPDCLKPNGKVLPAKVKIIFCIIESEYLTYCNELNDENVLGFQIAESINDFSSNEHWSLPKDFRHTVLSANVEGPDILANFDKCVVQEMRIPLTRKGQPNAALYWFEYELSNGITLSTKESDFFDYACYLFNECSPNKDFIDIIIKQQGAFVKIYADDSKDS